VDHWQGVRDSGEPEVGWYLAPGAGEKFSLAKECVLDWLDRPWHLLKRWRAWRRAPSVGVDAEALR
jgi:hypothetical protein